MLTRDLVVACLAAVAGIVVVGLVLKISAGALILLSLAAVVGVAIGHRRRAAKAAEDEWDSGT